MSFAKKLRAYRHMMELTQDSIADALGIERTTYANYESGKKLPPADLVRLLARLFSLPVENLSPPSTYKNETASTMSLSDYEYIPWELPEDDPTNQEPIDFLSLSAEEKMLIVRYRLKKAAENRPDPSDVIDDIDAFIKQFHSDE